MEVLSEISPSQSQAAYAAFAHGLIHKWNCVLQTHVDVSHMLSPLESMLRARFIPSLTGQDAPGHLLINVLALPARLGGLGIINPVVTSIVDSFLPQPGLLVHFNFTDCEPGVRISSGCIL